MSKLRWLLLPFSCLALVTAHADTTFTSQPTRVHLLELFTSEGCSSCPPAETWLSQLKNAPGLWTDFVPLAFHVDYWDRLGWRDPFAAKAWTARQYRYSAAWKSSSVYTPAFVLNGREWRERSVPPASSETPGKLTLTLKTGDRATVNFQPTDPSGRSFAVHLARLGSDVKIDVKAGENSGRQLRHDFIVLGLNEAPLTKNEAALNVPSVPQSAARQAVVAWITEAGGTEPLQAVGGWLP